MVDALILFFSAAIVNNFVLVRFLGICPFIGVSNQLSAALGMGGATTFVLVLSALICTLANNYVLMPLGLTSLDLIVDIIIIAVAVQLVEIVIRKTSYGLYQALGIYLPLITTNCIVLGLVLLNTSLKHSITSAIVYALGAGAGFTLVLLLFAAMRERLVLNDVPGPFKGTAIALISAGLMSLAFMGFAGFTGSVM